MPKLKCVIREQDDHKTKDDTYDVKIRITHKGKTRYIGTGYYVLPSQITTEGEVVNHDNATFYNIQLRNLRNLYDKAIAELGPRVRTMDMKSLVTYLRGLDPQGRDDDFFHFASKIVEQMDKKSYTQLIEMTITEMKAFSGLSLLFNEITPDYLERFQICQKRAGKAVNTTAIHMRNIRMIYNRAIDADKASLENYPFRRFKIKHNIGQDKDMDIEDLKIILKSALRNKAKIRARDMFILSFYLCGLNFKDMLYAKKRDIIKGRLVLSRIKTGQPLSIFIQPEAQAIIDKYEGDKFLLSILERKLKTYKRDRNTILYKDIISQTNKQLKLIAKDLELPYNLSTYYARHTWASIAFNECGASEEIIALALGHASPRRITAGYIRKKYELVDNVNRRVIDLTKNG